MSALLAFLAAALQPADFAVDEQDRLLEFRYRWPAAAEAIAPLRAHLAQELARARVAAASYARIDRADAAEQGRPFEAHWYDAGWRVDGSTPQLLSLSAEISSFTGGVHGNTHFAAILWDRAANRRRYIAALLGQSGLESLRPRFCAALDAMRAERRGREALARHGEDDPFTACPPLADQVMAPADEDGDGRFDTLHVLLGPYAAGPFAEGEYQVELAFEPGELSDVPGGFRPAFEAASERN